MAYTAKDPCPPWHFLFAFIFTHGPLQEERGSTDGLFLLLLFLLLLLLPTSNLEKAKEEEKEKEEYILLLLLYCVLYYCTVLYCTVLYCTVLCCKKNPTHPPKKNHPHPLKKFTKNHPPPPNKKVQNKGGLNCTVDHGSCAANALLFLIWAQVSAQVTSPIFQTWAPVDRCSKMVSVGGAGVNRDPRRRCRSES